MSRHEGGLWFVVFPGGVTPHIKPETSPPTVQAVKVKKAKALISPAMKPEAMQVLQKRCATQAAYRRFELYKTFKKFDGSPGREHHGFPPLTAMAD